MEVEVASVVVKEPEPCSSSSVEVLPKTPSSIVSVNVKSQSLIKKRRKKRRWTYVMSFPDDLATLQHSRGKTHRFPVNIILKDETGALVVPSEFPCEFIFSFIYVSKFFSSDWEPLKQIEWNVAKGELTTARKRRIRRSCPKTMLVPDGKDPVMLEKCLSRLFNIRPLKGVKPPSRPFSERRRSRKSVSHGCDTTIASVWNGQVKYTVTVQSACSLFPGKYLNDEVIDFGMMVAIKCCIGSNDSDTVYMSTTAWLAMFRHLDQELPARQIKSLFKTFTGHGKRQDLTLINYMILPVSRERHWFLIIVCRPVPTKGIAVALQDRTNRGENPDEVAKALYKQWLVCGDEAGKPQILIFDSMKGEMDERCRNYADFHKDCCKYVTRALAHIHAKMWQAEGNKTLSDAVLSMQHHFQIEELHLHVPVQKNLEDCGIFIMAYMKTFLSLAKKFGHDRKSILNINWLSHFDHNDLKTMREDMLEYMRFQCAQFTPHLFPAMDKCSNTAFIPKKVNKDEPPHLSASSTTCQMSQLPQDFNRVMQLDPPIHPINDDKARKQ